MPPISWRRLRGALLGDEEAGEAGEKKMGEMGEMGRQEGVET
ncbi:MAG: hypothetical protein QNJ46_09255 [Leptolyngbyaceae cyanobacterium MO_188.B28]|nr:hypothetical protein [Leptolyngbyaceae cyanobacterium MO_188.B28]